MTEEKKNKYIIKAGCRVGFSGRIYESGRIIELTAEEAKQLAEYIEIQAKKRPVSKKQTGEKK